jgi:hypothetical protein
MAKVLHIQMKNMQENNDPEIVQIECEVKIMETNQPVFSETLYPQVVLKDELGTYKSHTVLNSEITADAQQYLLDVYAQTNFDKVYIRGGFSSAI